MGKGARAVNRAAAATRPGEAVIDDHVSLRDESFGHDECAEEGDRNQGVDAL